MREIEEVSWAWIFVSGFAFIFSIVVAAIFIKEDIILAVKILYIHNNEISTFSKESLDTLFVTIPISVASIVFFFLLYRHAPISTIAKLITISIALAILPPSAYLCLTEFASHSQTINVFNWGSALILAYIISAQLTTNNATSKSQNPTHNP